MLIKHSDGLLNYIKHPINNAIAEWLNGKIHESKTIGRGFRNFKNLRSTILFFLGKMNYPAASGNAVKLRELNKFSNIKCG